MPLVHYLFHRPGPTGELFREWSPLLLGVYAGIAVTLVVLGVVLHAFSARHGVRRRVARRIITYGLALQALGVVAVGLRALNWPVVSMRFFMYAPIVAEVVAAGYLWWWMRYRYPHALARYETEERRRSYLPRAVGGTVAPARRRARSDRKK